MSQQMAFTLPSSQKNAPFYKSGYKIFLLCDLVRGLVKLRIPEWIERVFSLEAVLNGSEAPFTLAGDDSYNLFDKTTIDVYLKSEEPNTVVVNIHCPKLVKDEYAATFYFRLDDKHRWRCEVVGFEWTQEDEESKSALFKNF